MLWLILLLGNVAVHQQELTLDGLLVHLPLCSLRVLRVLKAHVAVVLEASVLAALD